MVGIALQWKEASRPFTGTVQRSPFCFQASISILELGVRVKIGGLKELHKLSPQPRFKNAPQCKHTGAYLINDKHMLTDAWIPP